MCLFLIQPDTTVLIDRYVSSTDQQPPRFHPQPKQMAYSHGKVTVRQRLEGLYDVAASSFGDIEVALGLVDEDEEDSDIDF